MNKGNDNEISSIQKLRIRRSFFLFIFISSFLIWGNLHARIISKPVSPLLTGHYMPGFMNVRDFADPAPVSGLLVLDYNAYQSGSKFFGKDGKQVTQIEGPLGKPINLNLDVNGYSNTPMILWASKDKVFGATYYGGATISIITANPNLAYSRIGFIDSAHQSGNINAKVSGLSDLGLMPIYLSWGLKNLDVTTGWMIYAPTGRYTTGGNNNTGLGFWSNLFQAFGYWYPEKVNDQPSKALAVMFGGTLELASKIKDADVKPGNRFSIDYGLSQFLSDNLEVGIYGGNNWQVAEDKGSQVYWDASVKDRVGVAGFQLGYFIWANRLEAVAKYGWNYGAIQRFELSTYMLNLIFITNALTGNKPAKAKH